MGQKSYRNSKGGAKGGGVLIPLGNKAKQRERQTPTHLTPGQPRAGGEEQERRKEQGEGTHTLWFKGCGALAVERQEPSHFLPEAADKTDRRTGSACWRVFDPKAPPVTLQAAAITLPHFPRGSVIGTGLHSSARASPHRPPTLPLGIDTVTLCSSRTADPPSQQAAGISSATLHRSI